MGLAARRLGFLTVLAAMLAWSAIAHAACSLGSPGATQPVEIGRTGRSMLVHLPAGFDPARPSPIVFLLHGSGGSGSGMLQASKLAATADRHGFIVAAPDGGIAANGGFVWNIPGVPTVTGKVPTPEDPDDVAYIGQALDWLAGQGCVDPSRAYVTGLSGGGRMSSWLGCVASERFAAIAPVVGLRAGNPTPGDPQKPDPSTCRPKRPVPVIAFAGDKDTVNPIQGGGTGYWQYPMHAAEQRWAELNGCKAPMTIRRISAGVYEERYTACRGAADVVGVITEGAGHVWVADNDAMWAFFSRYRR
jgi:polyhydroxybutyrate depolymerase